MTFILEKDFPRLSYTVHLGEFFGITCIMCTGMMPFRLPDEKKVKSCIPYINSENPWTITGHISWLFSLDKYHANTVLNLVHVVWTL